MYKRCTLSLCTLRQLGIFRKTSISGQSRVDWLRSGYRTYEWGYSVDFLRLEGYEACRQVKLSLKIVLKLTIQHCTTTSDGSLLFFIGVQVVNLKSLI